MPFLQKQDKKAWQLAKNMWFLSILLTWNQHAKIKNVFFPSPFSCYETPDGPGELLIRFEARQDLGNPVYLNVTWPRIAFFLLFSKIFWCFHGSWFANVYPVFGCLLLGFVECLGEPEVSKSKSIARGWASCWADQAFALRRRNSMDLKRKRCEKMWEVDPLENLFQSVFEK